MMVPEDTGFALFVSRHDEHVYRHPIEIVCTHDRDRVASCLHRIEAAVGSGLHAAGFLAYEAAPAFDPALVTHPSQPDFPLLWFALYAGEGEALPSKPDETYEVEPWTPLITRDAYRESIARIQSLIAAGDTYQVNYTFPLRAEARGNSLAWFRDLCTAQGADHCAYLDMGRFKILSASPELFFELDGGRLVTRPMKGTRRRGRWPDEDRRVAGELAASPKDRAENVMIVDLLRNDMGRVSTIGSVEVDRLFEVERYETVWQMTSTISSHCDASVSAILAALFPCGSVTGAPKPRTMAIIRDEEIGPRGVYCGCIGRWLPGRRASFNVAIRTVTLDTHSATADFHVGGGITWGSTPSGEYEECQDKAAFLTVQRPRFELLESILLDTSYFLLEEHVSRLEASADYFAIPFERTSILRDLDVFRHEHSSQGAPLKVRLLLARDGAWRIEGSPAAQTTPVRVGLAASPIDDRDVFLFHKTTHRAVYEQARDSRRDCEDVLMWNARGEVTESTTANVAVRRDGRWLTPPISCGLLAGTFRAHLLATGQLQEAILTKDDLVHADEIRLLNSVRKWIPVRLIP